MSPNDRYRRPGQKDNRDNIREFRQRRRKKTSKSRRTVRQGTSVRPPGISKGRWIRGRKRNYERPPRRFVRNNRQKLLIAFGVMVALMAALIIRVTYINISSGDQYSRQVLSQLNYTSTTIPYRRGDITDRNGTVLATSEKVYNLVLDAYVLTNSKVEEEGDCIEPTLDVLEEYFGLDSGEVKDLIEENPESRYRVMLRQLTYEQIEPYYALINSEDEDDLEVSQYVKGIWFEDDYLRRYPYNTLACDLLGFTVAGNEGTYGVEQQYNDVLNGTDGREYGYLTGTSDLERTTIAPANGENVMTTIDVNIQRIVEEKIWEFNEAIGSMNTSVIVMDPNSGEILAMASYPVFNLNEPRDLSNYYTNEELEEYSDNEVMTCYNELWRNFTISDAYEPGSTAKLFTVAAALDADVVKTDDEFYCDGEELFEDGAGYTRVGDNGVHGMVDLSQALMQSCNDAMMQIGAKLGKTSFIQAQENFNFGQLTNIDLPGEASANTLLYYEDTMGTVELATCSFGQGFSSTAIQVAAAFSSLVNGGSYYQPHVVKEITTESGSTVEAFEPELVRTTVSKSTSEWIKDTLLKTVGKVEADGSLTQGTGSGAYIDGYTIGGKTGTAEKKPIEDGKCTVSFISCAPAEDPQVVVYVVIDEPQVLDQGSSYLATIMTRKIYEELLPYMQIFPNNGSSSDTDTEETQETEEDTKETAGTEETSESGTDAGGESDASSESGGDATGESGEDSQDNGKDGGSGSSLNSSTGLTFQWPHLTDEEKDEVIWEYLGVRNTLEARSDTRPGAQTVEKQREAEKAKQEEETGDAADESSESGASESNESDTSESDTSESGESDTGERG